MAQWSFPWQDIEGDRLYSDSDFARFYQNLFTNGVAATVGKGLSVSSDSGMNLIVSSGAAVIDGRQFFNSDNFQLSVPVASTSSDRTDSIIIRMDIAARTIELLVKEGSTTVERSENIFELQLATVEVKKNTASISSANIKDKRPDEKVCGYSTPYEQISVSGLENQYEEMLNEIFKQFAENSNTNKNTLEQLLTEQQTMFQEWFEKLQIDLDGNVASNLQKQLNNLNAGQLLCGIEHRLDCYPIVSVSEYEYGIGLIGLGEEPEGLFGGSNVKTIRSEVEYLNRNKMKIFVPSIHEMPTGKLEKLSDSEYMFNEGTKTILIKLGGI